MVSSVVVAAVLVLLLRKPFTSPGVRAMERELRRREKGSGAAALEPAFPVPPLPMKALTTPIGASKEKAHG